MSAPFEELSRRLAEIGDLSAAASLLAWDQQVMMPPRGAASRAEHLATLKHVTHEKFTSPEIGRLLEELAPFEEAHDYDSFEASLIRVTRRDWEKARKVPSELRAEMSRAASLALPVWVEARANNDFAAFLPALRENVELRRRYIACFDGDYAEPYDAVLDDFERGMTTAEVRSLFDYLKEHQAPLVKLVAGGRAPEPPPSARSRSSCRSSSSSRSCAASASTTRPGGSTRPSTRSRAAPGATTSGSRPATSRTTSTGSSRRCTRPATASTSTRSPRRSSGRRSAAAPRSGCTSRRAGCGRTSSGARSRRGASSSRSSSRRSPRRSPGYDVDRWYREINAVRPSLIRVEADEATYNLHIILRFELEQELLDESFPLESLPEEWNRRM